MLTDEKEEKKQLIASFETKEKEWSSKVEASQKELREKVEDFGKERIKWAKKYYLTIGFSIALVLALLAFAYPQVKSFFE